MAHPSQNHQQETRRASGGTLFYKITGQTQAAPHILREWSDLVMAVQPHFEDVACPDGSVEPQNPHAKILLLGNTPNELRDPRLALQTFMRQGMELWPFAMSQVALIPPTTWDKIVLIPRDHEQYIIMLSVFTEIVNAERRMAPRLHNEKLRRNLFTYMPRERSIDWEDLCWHYTHQAKFFRMKMAIVNGITTELRGPNPTRMDALNMLQDFNSFAGVLCAKNSEMYADMITESVALREQVRKVLRMDMEDGSFVVGIYAIADERRGIWGTLEYYAPQ